MYLKFLYLSQSFICISEFYMYLRVLYVPHSFICISEFYMYLRKNEVSLYGID